jgi:hypothetical protein
MGERVQAEFVSADEAIDEEEFLPVWRERLHEIDTTVRAFAAERPITAFIAVMATGYLIGRILRKL